MPRSPNRLQWGHGFSAVESTASTQNVLDLNGLQWGHGFSAVERIVLSGTHLDDIGASMGPRLLSRGE